LREPLPLLPPVLLLPLDDDERSLFDELLPERLEPSL
jgi:hypothetical protein